MHTQIASLKAINNYKAQVSWVENGSLQNLIFRLQDAFENVKIIAEKYRYEDNFPDLLGNTTIFISDKEIEKIYDKRGYFCNEKIKKYEKLLTESNNRLSKIETDDQKLQEAKIISEINDELFLWNEYKTDIHRIEINRNTNIPNNIPNQYCWFDCWYDIKSKCYVTFNSNFLKPYSFDFHQDVKNFNKENKLPNVCVIPEEYIVFIHGYPCISSKITKELFHDKTENNETPFIILPNMTDEMLNDNLISKWHGVSISEDEKTNTYKKIPVTIYYYTNKGSRIILTNNTRVRFSQKERDFLMNRKVFPKELEPLLP